MRERDRIFKRSECRFEKQPRTIKRLELSRGSSEIRHVRAASACYPIRTSDKDETRDEKSDKDDATRQIRRTLTRIIAETMSLGAMYPFDLPRCNYNAAKFLARKIALGDHHCSAHWRAKQSRDVRSDPIELLSTHRWRW